MSLGMRIRGGLAALLSASLLVSGALLTAPAASAVEDLPPAPAVEGPIVDSGQSEVSEPLAGGTIDSEADGVSPLDSDPAPATPQLLSETPPAVPSVSVSVKSASETSLVLEAAVSGLTPADLPNGVHVGVLPGELDPTTSAAGNFLGAVGSVRPADMPASGAFTIELIVPVASLTDGKALNVLVWKRHTNPSAANNLAVSAVSVSAAEWDQVFPPAEADAITALVADVTAGTGIIVDVAASQLPEDISWAYVAVFEKPAVAGAQLEMNAFTPVRAGALTTSLDVPIASLDRTKSYEVVIWKQHSFLNDANLYQRTDLIVTAAQWDALFGKAATPAPQPQPAPAPAPAAQSAGSLTWGISTSFANYVTGNVAKGAITTNGVGGGRGGYVFPQATGGSWNPQTQTGSVPFTGVVTFTGHDGGLSRVVSNPVITVTSASTATISISGQPFGTLNLAAATKTVGANGEITWSNVPVSGGFDYGQYDLAADSLTFTVGAPSGVSFGSTTVLSQALASQNRTAAPAPPATDGIRVITAAKKLVAGGEIEFEASGFLPNERNILVVMYSEPTVLDTNAGADENGVVRWIGTLPEGFTGQHTITLQGSINVGKVIMIAEPEAAESVKATASQTEDAEVAAVQAAGIANGEGPAWAIWVGALALLVVAGGLTTLVIAQRRRAVMAPSYPTVTPHSGSQS